MKRISFPGTALAAGRASPRRGATAGALALMLLLSACGGGNGTNGTDGIDGANGLSTRTLVSAEAVGLNCTGGGTRIDAGLDSNGDGTLQSSEISSTQYVCNGSLGANGSNGLASLVSLSAEPAGAHCASGGTRVDAGIDANGSGVLDAAEISSTSYVCQGSAGANGATGATGATGAAGATGATGAAGAAGNNSLMSIVTEPNGANCTYGGSKISAGLDSNANGVLDAGEITSTTYTCNGAPGPGVTWTDVTATAVQAQPNLGYLADNASQVVITLPAAPAIGDIVRVSGAGAGGWSLAQSTTQSVLTGTLPANYLNVDAVWTPRGSSKTWYGIASSADGSKLVAVAHNGQIYTSTDSGVTWTPRDSNRGWWQVASSADGSKLVAVVQNGYIYTSTDSGVTWTPRDSTRAWSAVASSADGSKLVAVEQGNQIYTSTDSGVTWTPHGSAGNWTAVASSADGSKLVAMYGGDQIYTSTDSGVTWTPRDSVRYWQAVASSADGSKLVAVEQGGQIYTSTDSGVTWTPRDSNRGWQAVASSADGSTLVAVEVNGRIYTSTDSGVTWTPRDSTRQWSSVASSADGTKLCATVFGSRIYTSFGDRSTLGTGGSVSGAQYDALELQYLGSGLFMPLSYTNNSGSFVVQ